MTYWMNNLQDLNIKREVLSASAIFQILSRSKVVAVIDYEHPVFTQSTLEGQAELHALQGLDNTYYAGAHLGFGFR